MIEGPGSGTRPPDPGGAGPIGRGLGAARGRAVGPAAVIRGPDQDLQIEVGAILVARIIHPHLAPLFFKARGVIVEEGALLQHATTLAREFGLPAVVGLEGATHLVEDGQWIEVRGDTGEVYPADHPARGRSAGRESSPDQ